MKLSIESIAAIREAVQVAATNTTLPVLEMVRLENSAGGFSATAGDGGVQVQSRCARLDHKDFLINVPADRMAKILGVVRGDVEASVTEKTLSIKAGESRFALPRYTAGEFPLVPEDEGAVELGIDSADLVPALKRTTPFAADRDVARPYLLGVSFSLKEGILNIVATDGFGLAQQSLDVSNQNGSFTALVPKSICQKLPALIGNAARVLVRVGKRMSLVADETTIDVPLLSLLPPDWRRVMRDKHTAQPAVKAGYATSIFGESLLVGGPFRLGQVGDIEINDKGLSISNKIKDGGGYEGHIPLLSTPEKPLSASFYLDGLRDILGLFPKEANVRLGYQDGQSPLFFESDDVPGYTALYMPMRG